MDKKLELASNKFIQGVGGISNILGINRFVAQLYAYLYLSHEPKSLDDIARDLGASKGNVSINIRELEKWGAVKNIWVKGSRKDFYEVEPDVKGVITRNLRTAMQKRANELSVMLDEFEAILKSTGADLTKDDAKIMATYKERMEKLRQIKDTVVSTLNLLNKFI